MLLLLTHIFCPTVAAQALPGKHTTVFLHLESPSCCKWFARAKAAGKTADQKSLKAHIAKLGIEHTAVCDRLLQLGCRIDGRVCRTVNTIRATVPNDVLTKLSALPMVSRVEIAVPMERHTSSSVPFVGAPAVWAGTPGGLTGTGIRVGIIDSGIDYTHLTFGGSGSAAFAANDPKIIEAGSFPTPKIIGGWDFVGDDYDATNTATSSPVPDPDPLDPAANGHGTSVASIVGGFGVLSGGTTYTGPYSSSINPSQFLLGPGVAPGVYFYALKVFGREGTTNAAVDALEWAADPNGDFDFSDRLDVVNMSLGSEFGLNTNGLQNLNVYAEAIQALSQLGCVVVTSAGNSGNTAFITGQPGTVGSCISVANSLDGGLFRNSIAITNPPNAAASILAVDGGFTVPLNAIASFVGDVIATVPQLACDPLLNASDVSGKIALIDRGTCTFANKIKRAQDAGAIAVIMVNNVDSAPFAMGGTPDYPVTIPGVMISRADGLRLRSLLAAGLRIRLGGTQPIAFPGLADTLSSSSSRGPSSGTISLKPEISAPGEEITSAAAGTGNGTKLVSGTSFAAPHVAGAAALLRQVRPGWSAENIKAALMNTTLTMADEEGRKYPASRVGAGRLDVDAAARTTLTAKAAGVGGEVALSFGGLIVATPQTVSKQAVLTNHGAAAITGAITIDQTHPNPGVSVLPSVGQITLQPGQSGTVTIHLTLDPARFGNWVDPTSPALIAGEPRQLPIETSGSVVFTQGSSTIRLPYFALLRAVSESQIGLPLARVPASVPRDYLIPFTSSGPQVGMNPSLLELGTTSPLLNLEPATSGTADILAVGATSDFLQKGSVGETILYFGVATAAPWTTPQSGAVALRVVIDSDSDGTWDYLLENSNQASIEPASIYRRGIANDVFKTALFSRVTQQWKSVGTINGYGATTSPASPFLSNVLVLQVRASELGLTNSTQLRYSAETWSSSRAANRLHDTTPWINMDLAAPRLTSLTQGGGIGSSAAGAGLLPFRLLSSPDQPAGSSLNPVAMMIHHANSPSTASETIEFVARPPFSDPDGDGMSDDFELLHFGTKTAGIPLVDSDHDGQSNLNEFVAGTHPRSASSRFENRMVRNPLGFTVETFARADRFYTLEKSNDLRNFTPMFSRIIGNGLPLAVPVGSESGKNFFRFRVSTE